MGHAAEQNNGIVDQVARQRQFQAAHPDVVIVHVPPVWTGVMTVSRRRQTVKRAGLGLLLDELGALAEVEAERVAIEAAYPAWHVWLSDLGRWWATRHGPLGRYMGRDGTPVTLDADSPAGLRDLLDDARRRAEIAAARAAR